MHTAKHIWHRAPRANSDMWALSLSISRHPYESDFVMINLRILVTIETVSNIVRNGCLIYGLFFVWLPGQQFLSNFGTEPALPVYLHVPVLWAP